MACPPPPPALKNPIVYDSGAFAPGLSASLNLSSTSFGVPPMRDVFTGGRYW